MDEYSSDEFKTYKMRKSKKAATEKPVTVDYSALAMRCLLMGQTPDPSIFEIGIFTSQTINNVSQSTTNCDQKCA